MPKAEGSFGVLERINDNAYKIDLSNKHDVSSTFNISDLAPYLEDEALRATPFEEEENDVKSVQEHSRDLILAMSFKGS